ncbi:glycoside hydrolase family 9 protein [Rubrolithibacter danxiaensis]|uniref:glycoside hydrolase family 9 protein n=1 Tax=Rubrolithibacter danxiaensis TaxID=3390805 RepID=UPI003BF902BA
MGISCIRKFLKLACIVPFLGAANSDVFAQSEEIKINQLGYYPNALKIAVITKDISGKPFYVINEASGDTVYTNVTSAASQSQNSSLKTTVADFSVLEKQGHYTLAIPGVGKSYPFSIDKNVLQPAGEALLKGFYFIRSSVALDLKFAGKWSRPSGHPDTAVLIHPSAASSSRPAGFVVSSPGGWYDAGDYNKYIVNSGITTGTILSAYEDFPAYFNDLYTNIPESGNAIPDILDEALYNIHWMLTMQDPTDGGVYHKCTNAAFDGMVMPGVTKKPRYLVQKSTAATLDFAAVTAQAARIFKQFEKQLPGLSDSCLKASQKAWNWARKNPALLYNQDELNEQFEPKITTGAYGDHHLNDEWFWAASELFATTGNKEFYKSAVNNLSKSPSLPSWSNVEMLGYYTLNRFKEKLPEYAKGTIQVLNKRIITLADALMSKVPSNAFQTVMGGRVKDFIWGSSAVAANQGIVLINAYLLTENSKYLNNALTNVDYLLGRNATGYCFVTGIGSKPSMNPHHRPSVADGIAEPVPGLLVGGPNAGMQDVRNKVSYAFKEPETAYADVAASFASNEIAINWNAPAVYLANAIEALQSKLTNSNKN